MQALNAPYAMCPGRKERDDTINETFTNLGSGLNHGRYVSGLNHLAWWRLQSDFKNSNIMVYYIIECYRMLYYIILYY